MLTHRAAKPQGNEMSAGRTCAALIVAASVTSTAVISCIDGQRRGSTMERALHDRQLRQPKGRHQCGRAPTRVRLQRRIRVRDRLLVGQVRRHRTRRSGPYEPFRPAAAAVHLDRNHWVYVYDWNWDCFQGDGIPMEWSPARSWTIYAPQPDGSLRGTWHTDIASGVCRGSVVWPVAAYPAPPR